jgi:hypothetical protein
VLIDVRHFHIFLNTIIHFKPRLNYVKYIAFMTNLIYLMLKCYLARGYIIEILSIISEVCFNLYVKWNQIN